MRTEKELYDIFIKVHKEVLDEHEKLCFDIADAMSSHNESVAKDLFVKLQKICKDKLTELEITPNDYIIIQENSDKWFIDCIPYVINKLMEHSKGE